MGQNPLTSYFLFVTNCGVVERRVVIFVTRDDNEAVFSFLEIIDSFNFF
jgi:hypothetical protein